MEKAYELKETAKGYLSAAEQLANISYPLAKDKRLFLPILENCFTAMYNGMNSLLNNDLKSKFFRVSGPDNFDSKVSAFSASLKANGLSFSYATVLKEMRRLVVKHRASPMEFSKGEQFIICDDRYNLEKITIEQLRGYILKTKVFIQELSALIKQNEGIAK
jgi:hypothetical protein